MPGDRYVEIERTADVEITPEQWEPIKRRAVTAVERRGKPPEMAFWDAVNDCIQVSPAVVVDGEEKSAADIAACADAEADR